MGGIGRVARVDADERDLPALLHRLLLEERELAAAWDAPRRPLVDHHGVALEAREPLAERLRAAGQQLRGLLVQRGQRGRGAAQLALRLGEVELVLGRAVAARLP